MWSRFVTLVDILKELDYDNSQREYIAFLGESPLYGYFRSREAQVHQFLYQRLNTFWRNDLIMAKPCNFPFSLSGDVYWIETNRQMRLFERIMNKL